jgi:hypothetical protein
VHATTQLMDEHDCDVLVLAGDDKEVNELREMLPDALRARIAASFRVSSAFTRREWQDSVKAILTDLRTQEVATALADLPYFQAHGQLVAGLPAVIEAANIFQVRKLYVAAALPVEDVVDELVELGRRFGMEVTEVQQRADLLEPYEGIAAVTYPAAGEET